MNPIKYVSSFSRGFLERPFVHFGSSGFAAVGIYNLAQGDVGGGIVSLVFTGGTELTGSVIYNYRGR